MQMNTCFFWKSNIHIIRKEGTKVQKNGHRISASCFYLISHFTLKISIFPPSKMSDCCVSCNKYLMASRARYRKVWDAGLQIFLSVRLMRNVERGSLVCDSQCYFQFVK